MADSVSPVFKDHHHALPNLEKEDISQGLYAREHYRRVISNHLQDRILILSVEDTKETAQQIQDFYILITDLTAVSQTVAEARHKELRKRWSNGSILGSS